MADDCVFTAVDRFQDHVPADEIPLSHQVATLNCHDCFRVVLEHWLIIARSKVIHHWFRMSIQPSFVFWTD